MNNSPHDSQLSFRLNSFSNRVVQRTACSCVLLIVSAVVVSAQANDTSPSSAATSTPQSTSEGIQKRWNEFGVWGGISFDSPTSLGLGTTPNARFGNIGLRYGRVLKTSKTVAFEWTIDAIPVAILSNDRFKQADLDEAWEIAERGPMRLHMADIHLYRARLFHGVKPYPWASPQKDLAAARKLIEQCGYWRRKEELEDAEEAAKNW